MSKVYEKMSMRTAFETPRIAETKDYLRAYGFWTAFALLTLVCYLQLLAVVAWYKLFHPTRISQAAHLVATKWARAIMFATPGWKWTYLGFENLPSEKDPPVVLVANHQSSADIGAIYLTQAQFRWLSKDSVFKLPCIGSAMKWAGYVSISRGNRSSHVKALKSSSEWIRQGISMFYFPEGTRSEDGKLQEFKVGAFRLAIEEGVAIQPIVLCGTRDMMLKNSAIPKPARLCLEVMPRVWPEKEETVEAFSERVRRMIADRLTDLERLRYQC